MIAGIAWPSLALVSSLLMEHHELRKTVGARKEVTEEKLDDIKVESTKDEIHSPEQPEVK